MSLVCKVCCDSSAHTRNEARLRGTKKGLVNVDNHADGVTSIYRTATLENQLFQLEKTLFW